jgi:integrase
VPCVGALAALIAHRRERRVLNHNLIFHVDAKSFENYDFSKSWATACKAAGCPGRLFHDLRRSAVRDMVRSGVSRTVAKTISGHVTDSVFARYDITDTRPAPSPAADGATPGRPATGRGSGGWEADCELNFPRAHGQ